MPRESRRSAHDALGPGISPPKPRPYNAKTDYGKRQAERDQQPIVVGIYKGTIYRRPDVSQSSWFLRFHLKAERRHYRKSLRTTNLTEARERATTELVQLLAKVASGQRILSISLRELLKRFSLHLEQQVAAGTLAARTLVSQHYRLNLGRKFLTERLPAGLDSTISSLDGTVFEGYLEWRLAKAARDRKNGTIRRDVVRDELLVIRKMFRYARKERLCTDRSIPVWNFIVERQGPQRARITHKNFMDFTACLSTWSREGTNAKDRFHRTLVLSLVVVVANTGMRSGEVFGLRNKDVEVRPGANECVITIRPETSKVRQGRRITITGLARSRSNPTRGFNVLSNWIERHQRHKGPNDFVYSPYESGTTSARDVFYHKYTSLRTKLKQIGLEWFDLYHCRHLWITDRLLAGESMHLVARAAGTSTAQIDKTYSHVSTELATREFAKRSLQLLPDGSLKVITGKFGRPRRPSAKA
jgi:integrase